MTTLRVFTFSPDWGLPTVGPFALKLLAWLRLAGIPHEQVIEDNPKKGPKSKNPWIELDGERIADSGIIIEMLGQRFGVDLDKGLDAGQQAVGHAWRRAFEEHFHQVLEWELFLHPAGEQFMRGFFRERVPAPLAGFVFRSLQKHMGRQLHARGLARFSNEEVAARGRADLDALSAFLGKRPFLLGDHPATADTAVFGQVAPLVHWPMKTPVAEHAKSLGNVVDYCGRMKERCFGG